MYLCQCLTFTPIQFAIYEWLKNCKLERGKQLTLIDSIYFCVLATTFAGAIRNPISTIIVRYQIEDHSVVKPKFFKRVAEIYREVGFVKLNRGMNIRLLERNMNAFFYLPMYEMTSQWFSIDNGK